MKDLNLLVFMTQLGLSVAVPFALFIFLALWLQNRFGWGPWVLWVGIFLGLVSAVDGFRSSLKTMKAMTERDSEDQDPPTAFNDHE